MSRHQTLSSQLGMALLVLNLVAWGAWAFFRAPYSAPECAALQVRRTDRDPSDARAGSLVEAYTRTDHLLFSRPLHALSSEPIPLRVLYVANALPLIASWSFVVPSPSSDLGPTCSESRTCGILLLVLSSAQWGLVGGALGVWLSRLRL